jgi:carbon-monoxide dehydrogenase medium subunit
MIALDAEFVIRSAGGERSVGCDGFFRGAFLTGLGADEILTEVRLPAPRDDAGSAYVSLSQPASGYSMVGVAAVVIAGDGGAIADSRIAITGVGEAPYRATGVEQALKGSDGSADAIEAAAAHATDGVAVMSDIHADTAYRTAMAAVYTGRAITRALSRLA